MRRSMTSARHLSSSSIKSRFTAPSFCVWRMKTCRAFAAVKRRIITYGRSAQANIEAVDAEVRPVC